MSEIEKSFTFLHESIPSWFANLKEIEEKVATMHSEMAKVPISKSPIKRKSGSVESIRDLDAIMAETSASGAAQQNPALAGRKRKTPSVLSGHASGPSKYRSRTMIIVYYDGQIQKAFEQLVRNIGTGRNLLRKAKMAAKMEALADLANSDDEEDLLGDNADTVTSKIGYRHRGLASMRARAMDRARAGGPGASTPQQLFDSADKSLENAQSLCEKAAHQSLRDGDCRKELDGMKKYFEEVLEKATKEVEKYTASNDAQKVEPSDVPTVQLSPPPTKTEPKLSTIPKHSVHPMPATVPITVSKTMDIEVDDDDDDDDFVMPPIRLTSRAH